MIYLDIHLRLMEKNIVILNQRKNSLLPRTIKHNKKEALFYVILQFGISVLIVEPVFWHVLNRFRTSMRPTASGLFCHVGALRKIPSNIF